MAIPIYNIIISLFDGNYSFSKKILFNNQKEVKMKRFSYSAIILLLLGAVSIITAENFTGSKEIVVIYVPKTGTDYYTYGTFSHDIGYKREGDDVEFARTKYEFNLSTLPSNANNITSVSLGYSFSNYGTSPHKFSITDIGSKFSISRKRRTN
ncbi:MAG: hypothetical protein HND52_02725 [Ignavibacteriae bacterium]|nr:hypothetical protein [Ignavibacteriota bacterium]NOG96865.1 hypothetical protein [Ignavibacteriota bacterium]